MTTLATLADTETPARPASTWVDVEPTPAPIPAPATVPTASDSTVSCPACGQPAVIEWRDLVAGTSGPVVHVKVRCPEGRHWFLMLEENL
jgi:hypothetical protein